MDNGQQEDFLNLLKTLAEEQRLMMVRLMSEREYTTTEIAQLLGRTEPTISHHVSKLHSVGLLHLRMAGNQRFYQINSKRLAVFKQYAAEIDQPLQERPKDIIDNSWIETSPFDEETRKVLRDYTAEGRLVQLPTKEKKWLAILRWLATHFEPGVRYTEKEVNTILTAFHEDYATMRRNLVEYGFMRRERGGGDYWLTPENE